MLTIFWSPGNVQVSDQGLMAAAPVLASTIWHWKPPAQLLVSEYTARQAGGAVAPVGGGVPFTAPGSGNWMPASSACLAALTGVASRLLSSSAKASSPLSAQ